MRMRARADPTLREQVDRADRAENALNASRNVEMLWKGSLKRAKKAEADTETEQEAKAMLEAELSRIEKEKWKQIAANTAIDRANEKLQRAVDEARAANVRLLEKESQSKAALASLSKSISEVKGRLEKVESEKESEIAAAESVRQELTEQVHAMEIEMSEAVGAAEKKRAEAEEGLEDAQREIAHAERKIARAEGQRDDARGDLAEVARELDGRGRPKGHAGREEIERKWDGMSMLARQQAVRRHKVDIINALQNAGCDDWLPIATVRALEELGIMNELWSTRPLARRRMAFAHELVNVLRAEWGVRLALFIKDDVELSDRQYSKLRLALSKRFRAGHWEKRLWYQCPITGEMLWLPEPLVSRHHWWPEYKKYLQKYELSVTADGKVAERGFRKLLRTLIERDLRHLTAPTPLSPWHPAFHIDATSISSARGFTHAGITLGAMYRERRKYQSELKLMTLAVGLCKDNAPGLMSMLGDGESEGIAAEFSQVCKEKSIRVSQGGEEVCAPCEPVMCLDFAAARCMRNVHGKAACLCACQKLARLQSYPGDGTVPAIPEGDDLATWKLAEGILKGHCSYGTELMSFPSLRMAAHVPPPEWDFVRDGPWRCEFCRKAGLEEIVWRSWGEYHGAVKALEALRERALDDDDAKKELSNKLSGHAEHHIDQVLYGIPVIHEGTLIYIIDPMHCLELNLAKTAWKYSWGDRMLEPQREKVASYLGSIDLYLDIRAKGKRDPQQKWFSAAQVDLFVDPPEKHKSPGLMPNVLQMCQLVHDSTLEVHKRFAGDGGDDADESQRPAKKPSGSRRNRQAPTAGFAAAAAAAAQKPVGMDLSGLGVEEGELSVESAEVGRYVSTQFGNHRREVLDIFRLWTAYGQLFAAWRDEWTADDENYRARRALRFLRAGTTSSCQ